MAKYSFAKADRSAAEIKARLDAVQEDAMRILSEGGVSNFAAQNEWRVAAAALIREAVVDQFKMTDPTPIFTERRDGQQGMTYEFERLINTLRVVEYSPQSTPTIFTPRKGKHTISTAGFELPFGIPLQKIINGQHTIGEFAQMASEAMTRHYVNLTLTAINTACATGAKDLAGRALRTAAAGTDVAKSEVDGALRRMNAFNQGVTIFGTRWALDPIYSFAGALSVNLADELNARGVIGTYRGANLVELTDDMNIFYHSFTQISGIALDKLLFIASGKPGAILMEKQLSQLNWEVMDQRKAQWSTGVRFDHGILVHSPWRYGVIELA